MKHLMLWSLWLGLAGGAVAARPADYYRAYLSFLVLDQTVKQAEGLLDGLAADAQGEAREAIRTWSAGQKSRLRGAIGTAPEDRSAFETFVSGLVEAEAAGDPAALAELARGLDLAATGDYAALRQQVIQRDLGAALEDSSRLLGVLQTWSEQQRAGLTTGPLRAWLERAAQPPPAAPPPPPRAARSALAAAEVPLGDYQGPDEEETSSPLAAFGALRAEQRAREVEEARAGMQQVAEERKAAEEEYAQKKAAEAQADAEAVKRQADRLAAVDQQAQEQRQKSWGNRLKSIVASTIGAATGAFTGGIGTRAGQEAAAAVFDD